MLVQLCAMMAMLSVAFAGAGGQSPAASPKNTETGLTVRRYRLGEALRYQMFATNEGRAYSAVGTSTTKQDADGTFYEEIGWSEYHSNRVASLSATDLSLRQTVSLSSRTYMKVPRLSGVDPFLIGPITDMLTFYSDLFLSERAKLVKAGQHIRVPYGRPNSWADGTRVLLGEDSIDFDLTLDGVDEVAHTATVEIRHIAPEHPQIKLPAKWMETPVDGVANNWVQVEKVENGYVAAVGDEVFDVRMTVDTRDGKILAATLHNPVTTISRACVDAALEHCQQAVPHSILREVSIILLLQPTRQE